jgi:acyl-CoA thioester hydrolase
MYSNSQALHQHNEKIHSCQFTVKWADLDANMHLKNTAYLDYAAQTRLSYLDVNGVSPAYMLKNGIGPVVFTDNIKYFREFKLMEMFLVTYELLGLNQSGSKFAVQNRFFCHNNSLAATVISHGAWFNLKQRKVTVPPIELADAMCQLRRGEGFAAL